MVGDSAKPNPFLFFHHSGSVATTLMPVQESTVRKCMVHCSISLRNLNIYYPQIRFQMRDEMGLAVGTIRQNPGIGYGVHSSPHQRPLKLSMHSQTESYINGGHRCSETQFLNVFCLLPFSHVSWRIKLFANAEGLKNEFYLTNKFTILG